MDSTINQRVTRWRCSRSRRKIFARVAMPCGPSSLERKPFNNILGAQGDGQRRITKLCANIAKRFDRQAMSRREL
jgi:hypothetical protein